MSQFVSDDSGPIISTPSAVTMAISCYGRIRKYIFYWFQKYSILYKNHTSVYEKNKVCYPVVGTCVSVVQNFKASLYQCSCLIFSNFYLVLQNLPHQGLSNKKTSSNIMRHINISKIDVVIQNNVPEPNRHQILLRLMGLHRQLLTCPHNQESWWETIRTHCLVKVTIHFNSDLTSTSLTTVGMDIVSPLSVVKSTNDHCVPQRVHLAAAVVHDSCEPRVNCFGSVTVSISKKLLINPKQTDI